MKKLLLLAVALLAVMAGCKNKGQTAPADEKDSVAAVIDSIIEENDTTPLPMFLIGGDGKYMHMLYWANIEEPQRSEGDEDYFDAWHKSWEFQEMCRRNAAQYTNRLLGRRFPPSVPVSISSILRTRIPTNPLGVWSSAPTAI